MSSENERVELAMKIMRYRALAAGTTDNALLAVIKRQLREIDE